MKGTIALLKEVRNEHELIVGYEIVINLDEIPKLKLGPCEIRNTR